MNVFEELNLWCREVEFLSRKNVPHALIFARALHLKLPQAVAHLKSGYKNYTSDSS